MIIITYRSNQASFEYFRPKRKPSHSDSPPPSNVSPNQKERKEEKKRKGKRHSEGKHKQKSFPLAFRPTANPKAFVSSA